MSNNVILESKSIYLHTGKVEVKLNGEVIYLPFYQFKLLQFLMQKPSWVFSRRKIINEVRGYDYSVTEKSVDVNIVSLRKKLKPANIIETVRGAGYKFTEEVKQTLLED